MEESIRYQLIQDFRFSACRFRFKFFFHPSFLNKLSKRSKSKICKSFNYNNVSFSITHSLYNHACSHSEWCIFLTRVWECCSQKKHLSHNIMSHPIPCYCTILENRNLWSVIFVLLLLRQFLTKWKMEHQNWNIRIAVKKSLLLPLYHTLTFFQDQTNSSRPTDKSQETLEMP